VADGSNIHEEVKASVEILHEAESPENLTSEKQMTNIVGQLNNAKQLKKQVGGAQKIQELQDQLINSIKFDDAALDAFIAHVATYHKSKRSLQIRQVFGGLKGTDPDTRKTAATSDSKRVKVNKLLLEFAGKEEGMDALVQGYVEPLLDTHPD